MRRLVVASEYRRERIWMRLGPQFDAASAMLIEHTIWEMQHPPPILAWLEERAKKMDDTNEGGSKP